MSKINDNFIKAIESLPYDIDEELKTKESIIILQDVTKKYVELFGTDDLNENYKMCIQSILSARTPQKIFQEKIIRKDWFYYGRTKWKNWNWKNCWVTKKI